MYYILTIKWGAQKDMSNELNRRIAECLAYSGSSVKLVGQSQDREGITYTVSIR